MMRVKSVCKVKDLFHVVCVTRIDGKYSGLKYSADIADQTLRPVNSM